jgi:transglutaminase-like putative cysteine protease
MKHTTILVLAALASLTITPTFAAEPVPAPFRDAREIRISKDKVEFPDDQLVAWGRAQLTALGVADQPAAARAERIAQYIHSNFGFTPDRPATIADFVAAKAGNCYAHARLSAFLLRLAEVPAKFVYDVHLEHKSPSAAEQARAIPTGMFGQYHNDHFWLLYFDGTSWIPFDSSLGIANRADFLRAKVDQPTGGVANPPFLLWQQSPNPTAPMENITANFWTNIGRPTIPRVPATEWQALLDSLGRLEVVDLHGQPLTADQEAQIARVARAFFGVTP